MSESYFGLTYQKFYDDMVIIGQVSNKKVFESQFGVYFNDNLEYNNNYFIDGEGELPIITCQQKNVFTFFHYGMVPFWSGKKNLHFEAPVEGEIDENSESESLKRRIIIHPAYRKPIRENRCLIPADYIIMPSSYGEVYLVYFTESKPFAIAGIYDTWKESYRDDEEYKGFSMLTVPSNNLLKKVGIGRMPLFLNSRVYEKWLDREAPLTDITVLMDSVPDKFINGYPIHRNTYLKRENSPEIYKSSGELLRIEENIDYSKLSSVLKAFRYKKGTSHGEVNTGERIWR
jgi:putative SOS response-associated peptidase YedK